MPTPFGPGLTVGYPSRLLVETPSPPIRVEDPKHCIAEGGAAEPVDCSAEKRAAISTAPVDGDQVNRVDLTELEILRLALSRPECDQANRRAVLVYNKYAASALG